MEDKDIIFKKNYPDVLSLKIARKNWHAEVAEVKKRIAKLLDGFDCDVDYALNENVELEDMNFKFKKKLQLFPFPLNMELAAQMLTAKKYSIKTQSKIFEDEDGKREIFFHYYLGIVQEKPVLFLKKIMLTRMANDTSPIKTNNNFSISLYAILGGKYPMNLYRFDSNHKASAHDNKFLGNENLVKIMLNWTGSRQDMQKMTNCLLSMPINFEKSWFTGQHEHWYNILTTALFPDCVAHGDITQINKPLTLEEAKRRVDSLFSLNKVNFNIKHKTTIKEIVNQIENRDYSDLNQISKNNKKLENFDF